MARLGAFDREIAVATAGLSEPEIAKKLARTAHEALAQSIAAGEASPAYRKFVNGRPDADEETVRPPGPILYLFDYATEIAEFALQWARDNSPLLSGAYRDAWFVLAGGQQVAPSEIPPGSSFIVTNDRPYARKIEVGTATFSVPPGIVERLRQAVLSRYGNLVSANVRFISLQGGYVLKGRGRRAARRDRRPGAQLTYPSLVLDPR